MIFQLDDKAVLDDTILVFGIRYRGSNSGRIYTYVGMKAGGRWYFTGSGRTPQDAAWLAVQRWLQTDGRVVVWVKVPTRLEVLWEKLDDLDGEVVERPRELAPAAETDEPAGDFLGDGMR